MPGFVDSPPVPRETYTARVQGVHGLRAGKGRQGEQGEGPNSHHGDEDGPDRKGRIYGVNEWLSTAKDQETARPNTWWFELEMGSD